jgi:predicted metal-dependent phosphoesterase TrpH
VTTGLRSGGPVAGAFVDLHAHSTASDGTQSPVALVARAKQAGLAAVAITDHDTLGGAREAVAEGERLGIEVVCGTELSAVEGDDELHLLALHVQDVPRLERELESFRRMRVARAEEMVDRLAALGIAVTMGDVLAESAGGAVGRPHVARAIVKRGGARDMRDAFDRFIGAGRPAYVAKEQLAIADAIRIAHEAGAIAVAAHLGGDGTREYVEQLRRLGLDGLEVRHPSHSADDMARLGALADHYGMVKSGGSDWHGANDGPRALGVMQVPRAWLDQQRERAESLRRAGA